MPMGWLQFWIITGILNSFLLLPLMDFISQRANKIAILLDDSAFSSISNDSKPGRVFQFQRSFEFNIKSLPSVHATDPDSTCPVQSILCVECRSDRHPYCQDPFNRTLLNFNDIPYTLCHGYCVKWIRAPLIEDSHQGDLYIRTCSNNLNLRLQISLVCLQESHSFSRRLCFCDRSKCNSTVRLRTSPFTTTIGFLLVYFVL